MTWTPYHAQYFAHELTQRVASKIATEGFDDAQNLDKITASLSDAQVDLNLHQVDAALFALRSPLSQGVILADEVGLGKTIEAGIVVAQRWAEHKRRILVIAPANLRKQKTFMCSKRRGIWSSLTRHTALPLSADVKTTLEQAIQQERLTWLRQRDKRDDFLFTSEMTKLDRWAEDQRLALHTELRELEQEIRLRRNLARQINALAEKVKEQRAITELEKRLADKRFKLHDAENTIEQKKNDFLDNIEKKISTKLDQSTLFIIKWRIQ